MKFVVALLITLACYCVTIRVQKWELQRNARLTVASWEQAVLAAGGMNPTWREKAAIADIIYALERDRLLSKIHTLQVYPASQTNLNAAMVPLIPNAKD